MGHGRAVTLHDVAREAGVAVSTVSRALSNPDRVSARTREHVQAVAPRLDYRPNLLAQALPSGRTRMLALLVTDITNPHHFGLIRGAEAQARAAGLHAGARRHARASPELEADRSRTGWGPSVDGFVLASSRLPDDELVEPAGPPTRGAVQPGGRRVPRAWSPTRTTAAARSSSTWSRSGHRALAYLAGPRNAWADGRAVARARPATPAAAGRGDRAARPVPAHASRAASAAADVGLGRGRHRAGGVQRPARDRRAAPAGAARGRRARARCQRGRATTTSSAPTSATRR